MKTTNQNTGAKITKKTAEAIATKMGINAIDVIGFAKLVVNSIVESGEDIKNIRFQEHIEIAHSKSMEFINTYSKDSYARNAFQMKVFNLIK